MAITKKETDGAHPASHYLVVEDPEKVTTWHLRVRDVSGALDHRLMGAAWAALHEGYRGNRYEGPDKNEALAKLKRLYAQEDMDIPGKAQGKLTTVKAIEGDEWALDVLGNPYGSQQDKDADGEWFTPKTKLHEDKFPRPPAVYYHGYNPDNTPAGSPEYIGKTVSYQDKPDGRWYRVILNKANQYAQRIWEAARAGLARASTGSVSHLVRVAANGEILEWPVAELSLLDLSEDRAPANRHAVAVPVLKSMYQLAGETLPDICIQDGAEEAQESAEEPTGYRAESSGEAQSQTDLEEKEMNEEQKDVLSREDVAQIIGDALKAEREAQQAEREAEELRLKELEDAKKAAVEEARKAWQEELTERGRLPYKGGVNAPVVGKFGDIRKFDGLTPADQLCLISVLEGGRQSPNEQYRASEAAYKALAVKLDEDKSILGEYGRYAMKAAGLYEGDRVKANELNYSTLASYGDEWIGVEYSNVLWMSVRTDTNIAGQLPSVEVPPGHESITIPLESTDPTLYLTGQAASDAAATGLSTPLPTVTSSRTGTSNTSLTLKKLSARQRYTGELVEDSIIPWVSEINAQLQRAAAEQFEHAIIDGDTAATASTNINDIAGTPGGTEAFLAYNGFRKIAIGNNSRSGGALDSDDYLLTAKLLGAAGKVGLDPRVTAFIVDLNTYWKTLQNVTEVKTKDVWGASTPTIESGVLTMLWGRPLYASGSMHWISRSYTGYEFKANTAGKVDQDTSSNNTTGSILAVRWDHWRLGWRRRITVETVRHPEWDGWENTMHMRAGLINRDTNAAAISYNVTV